MRKDDFLQMVTENMNNKLMLEGIEARVLYNPVDGLNLSKQFNGVEIIFPNEDMTAPIKIQVTKTLCYVSQTIRLFKEISECSEIFEVIKDEWNKCSLLYNKTNKGV